MTRFRKVLSLAIAAMISAAILLAVLVTKTRLINVFNWENI